MNKFYTVIIVFFIFVSGYFLGYQLENPYRNNRNNNHNSINNEFYQSPYSDKTEILEEEVFDSMLNILNKEDKKDIPSPYDWIKEEQIIVTDKNVILKIKDAEWAGFADTKSMDPVIDKDSNAIQIVPKKESDIHIGDIISYESEIEKGILIHRVIDIGKDNEGLFYIVKGDNNKKPDPEKIRFKKIKRILVAIIY